MLENLGGAIGEEKTEEENVPMGMERPLYYALSCVLVLRRKREVQTGVK